MHYLKVPLFSFPHDLQGIPTGDLGQVVLYECKVRYNRLEHRFVIHRLRVASGHIGHGNSRWTWPWNGERMVSWGPHSKVVRLRLITCILPGQRTMGWNATLNRSALSSFEPTLQSRSMIYTIHGFTAGVFTHSKKCDPLFHHHTRLWPAAPFSALLAQISQITRQRSSTWNRAPWDQERTHAPVSQKLKSLAYIYNL